MSASDIDGDAAGNLAVPGGNFGQPSYSERCRKMGKAIRASALVLLLACSASAGVITHDVYQPPPPPPPQQQSSVEAQEPAVTDQQQTAMQPEEAAIQLAVNVALDLLALL